MFTLLFVAILFLIIALSARTNKVVAASTVAFYLTMGLTIWSVPVSVNQALGDLTPIKNERIFPQGDYATDGENVYQLSGGKGWLIPFAAVTYEICEEPDGYCANCKTIWGTSFCTDCGNELNYGSNDNICPTCESFCDTTYCGKCGTKVRED